MCDEPVHEITKLLKAWNSGDTEALDRLIPLVDNELKKIAKAYLRNEKREDILQTTALVHEALIKLIRENISWDNRKQFYALVARRMRQVLWDSARKRPKAEHLSVDGEDIAYERSKEIEMLAEALTKLASIDERKARVVECRFFTGLTLDEIAELLGISKATVGRDWEFARAWLRREMTGAPADNQSP